MDPTAVGGEKPYRTAYAADVSEDHAGRRVRLAGAVQGDEQGESLGLGGWRAGWRDAVTREVSISSTFAIHRACCK